MSFVLPYFISGMDNRGLSLIQLNAYSKCFNCIVEYLLGHKSVSLYEFERHFNDRSLTLFPDVGLDDFLLDFFSSADYCQLDRCYKSLLHNDIKILVYPKNKK